MTSYLLILFERRGKMKMFTTLLFLSLSFSLSNARALIKTEQINEKEKQELTEKIGVLIKEHYVFPDLGAKYGREIMSLSKSDKFDDVSDPKEFGEKVTAALQELTKDKHFYFRLVEKSDLGEDERGSLHHPVRYYRLGEKEHLGIFRLDWIANDVGYLDYRRFYYQSEAKRLLLGAMDFLSSANAIIIDLRENRGGSGKLTPWLCSYFLPHPTQLTGTYYRNDNIAEEWWTMEHVEGKRLLDVPLFLLIGKNTFSAAEYLAYDLKVRKRATLVGEPTKGGAHSVDLYPVGDRFEIYIPTARAVNPVTGSNWEGTGVLPDVQVPSEKTLETALELAKKAAQEYGQAKNEKRAHAVEKMQEKLDQAEALYEQGRDTDARLLLDAVFLDVSQSDMLNEFFIDVLAYHYSSRRSYQIATDIMIKQIELYPESPGACESLAWAYYRQGDKNRAAKYFKKVLELDKNNSIAQQMLEKLD